MKAGPGDGSEAASDQLPAPGRKPAKRKELAPRVAAKRTPGVEGRAKGATDARDGRRLDESDGSFAAGVSSKLATYVYLLIDPGTGRPFFVGRGRGDRCFRHVQEARSGQKEATSDAKYPVLERIRTVEAKGRPVRIDVLRYGLSREEALMVEASVRDALGLGPSELGSQRRPATEVSSLLAKRVKFKRAHQVVICRTGQGGADAEYETARHGWRIGLRWTDPTSVRSPKWAVLVAGDLVAGVHRIEGWEQTEGKGPGRYSFFGPRDRDLEKRYVGKSVAPYLGSPPQSPVTYVWCGPHWVNSAH